MPRTKAGTVPALQHHKATGQARVTVAGRDYYCGRWGSKAAIAKYHRLLGEFFNSNGAPPVAEAVPFSKGAPARYKNSARWESTSIRRVLCVVETRSATSSRSIGPDVAAQNSVEHGTGAAVTRDFRHRNLLASVKRQVGTTSSARRVRCGRQEHAWPDRRSEADRRLGFEGDDPGRYVRVGGCTNRHRFSGCD